MEKSLDSSEGFLVGKLDNSIKIGVKPSSYDMVVLSHLRWGFVYQRPQHIISRLSKKYTILFVEEPLPYEDADKGYELEEISPSLHILKPKVPSIGDISPILDQVLKNSAPSIGWFYSPAFSILIPGLKFQNIIYDCMDELSLFKGASQQLIEQEKYLLKEADLVFTGGKALYEAKKDRNENVHCFPSSVDRAHFEQAATEIPVPEDIKDIPAPIVGYFGVIDERLDMDLLRETAERMPEVSFVMIGPLAKIGEEDLPRRKNIHYLGMKSYANLPNYLKVFDIAMMPFALNDATKYISPTKTLEYMAAGIPIISTAIKDVVRDYSHCIHIISGAEEFSKAIKTITETHPGKHREDYQDILARTSWAATVEKMEQLIKEMSL